MKNPLLSFIVGLLAGAAICASVLGYLWRTGASVTPPLVREVAYAAPPMPPRSPTLPETRANPELDASLARLAAAEVELIQMKAELARARTSESALKLAKSLASSRANGAISRPTFSKTFSLSSEVADALKLSATERQAFAQVAQRTLSDIQRQESALSRTTNNADGSITVDVGAFPSNAAERIRRDTAAGLAAAIGDERAQAIGPDIEAAFAFMNREWRMQFAEDAISAGSPMLSFKIEPVKNSPVVGGKPVRPPSYPGSETHLVSFDSIDKARVAGDPTAAEIPTRYSHFFQIAEPELKK